jgi:hypothetical protein
VPAHDRQRDLGGPDLFAVHVFPRAAEFDEVLDPLPELKRALFTDGVVVPSLLGYRPSRALRLIEQDGEPPLLRFARAGARAVLGVEVPSGRVVGLDAELSQDPGAPAEQTWGSHMFASNSLSRFGRAVQAMAERFPFYSVDDEVEAWFSAAQELRMAVAAIEGLAEEATPFWEHFLYNVEIGDTAAERYADSSSDRGLSDAELRAVAAVAGAVVDAGPEALDAMRGFVENPRACSCAPLGNSRLRIPPGATDGWISLALRGDVRTAGGERFETVRADATLWTSEHGESDFVLSVGLQQPRGGGPVTTTSAHLRLV